MNRYDFEQFTDDVESIVVGPIFDELEYQNDLGLNHDMKPSVAEEILLIQEYLNKARTALVNNTGDDQALDVLRKTTAMCLRCLTNHGCPQRKN